MMVSFPKYDPGLYPKTALIFLCLVVPGSKKLYLLTLVKK